MYIYTDIYRIKEVDIPIKKSHAHESIYLRKCQHKMPT